MSLVKSFFTVSGLTLVSRISGFIRDMIIAAVMGAGPLTDVFLVALRIPNFFRRLFAEGAFNTAFVPIFSKAMAVDGKEKARIFAERIFSVLAFSLLAFTLIVEITMPWLMYGLAPGFVKDKEKFDLAILLTRITFPYLLFISLASLYTGILNSVGKFASGAAASVLLNICLILALLYFGRFTETISHAMAWAVTISGVLQFLWLFRDSKKIGMALKLKAPKMTADVKVFLRKLAPGAVGAGVVQINLFVDTIIASFIANSISYLYYADRVNQLPLSIIGTAMGIALLPMLSKKISEKKMDEVIDVQNRALEMVLFLSLPCMVVFTVASHAIIKVLFERGEFSELATLASSQALIAFSLGLPAFVMVKIFSTSFFAVGDTKTPVKAAITCVFINAVLNIILVLTLPKLGIMPHIGMALATSIASWINVFLLAKILFKKEKFKFDTKIKMRVPRILFSSLVMAGVIFFSQDLLKLWMEGGESRRISALLITLSTGAVAFFASVHFTGAYDLRELRRLVKRVRK